MEKMLRQIVKIADLQARNERQRELADWLLSQFLYLPNSRIKQGQKHKFNGLHSDNSRHLKIFLGP